MMIYDYIVYSFKSTIKLLEKVWYTKYYVTYKK